MDKLPTIICSTVVRLSQKGEDHGHLYRVNFETKKWEKIFSYRNDTINWLYRGGDRGLRGITLFNNKWYVMTTNSILEFSQDFKLLNEYKNQYLQSSHEISRQKNLLYISSTSLGSIIVFDLKTKKFITGYDLTLKTPKIFKVLFKILPTHARKLSQWFLPLWLYSWKAQIFNPNIKNKKNPTRYDLLHLNNVCVREDKIYFSGTTLPYFFSFSDSDLQIRKDFKIERQTHNPTVDEDVFYYNATKTESVVIKNRKTNKEIRIPVPETEVKINEYDPKLVRQRFARGLTRWKDNYYIGGSSPATVTLYDFNTKQIITSICLSDDLREAVHGLVVEN